MAEDLRGNNVYGAIQFLNLRTGEEVVAPGKRLERHPIEKCPKIRRETDAAFALQEHNRRLAAAAVDACIIGGLSVGVLWVTLRWLDLPLEQITTLPLAPMIAFHALVGRGYLLMFTAAGGQTIGKLLFGLRVVREREETDAFEAVTFSQAAYRVMLSLPSVLALGVGFVPALAGGDRAFHDRLAHTRVVRA